MRVCAFIRRDLAHSNLRLPIATVSIAQESLVLARLATLGLAVWPYMGANGYGTEADQRI